METQNLTAAQRLEGLEATAKALDMAAFQLTQQLSSVENSQRELSDQLKALIQLLGEGAAISETSVGQRRVDTKIALMKAALQDKIDSGVLSASDEVSETSFLVGKEVETATGNVQNARIQVALFAIKNEEMRASLLGKHVGDVVQISDSVSLEIQEIYAIAVEQPAPEAPAADASAPASDSPAPEAAPEQVAVSQ